MFRKFGTDSYGGMEIVCRECGETFGEHRNTKCPEKKSDPKKLAVHCPTKELWDRVQEKTGKGLLSVPWDNYEENACVEISNGWLRCCGKDWYKKQGYTIISAEEYLGEDDIKVEVGSDEDGWKELGSYRYKLNTKKEDTMNKNIAEVYEGNTSKEEKLVQKHMSEQVGTGYLNKLLLIDKKDEVLAEALRLEKEEEKDGE